MLQSSDDLLDVVIPAWNEAGRLAESLQTLGRALADLGVRSMITVVDNGSTDGTADIARRVGPSVAVPLRVLSCPERGKGAAVRVGLLASEGRWVGFMDADLATSLEALEPVVQELRRGSTVVIGTRRHDMSHLLVEHDTVRRIGGYAFRTAARYVVPGVTDTQCGFKFFDAAAGRELARDLQLTGWTFDVELLARARSRGLAIREVPVRWTNRPGSRFSPLVDGLASFRDLMAVRAMVRHEQRDLARPAVTLTP
jgi:glycosyltransferase involved in cell wall biosynthesis